MGRRGAYAAAVGATVLLVLPAIALAADPALRPPARPAVATCGEFDFPVAALRNPRGAEGAHTPSAAALRRFLASSENMLRLPRRGWRLLYRRGRDAEFGHRGASGQIESDVDLHRERHGWRVEGFGGCTPERVVHGFELPSISLARSQRLTSSVQDVQLRLGTGTCYPGDPNIGTKTEDRFDHFEAIYTATVVRLLAVMRPEPFPPNRDCLGVGLDIPRTVHLAEPLGDRRLLDDHIIPAAALERAPF
jgi:hypothetical protein